MILHVSCVSGGATAPSAPQFTESMCRIEANPAALSAYRATMVTKYGGSLTDGPGKFIYIRELVSKYPPCVSLREARQIEASGGWLSTRLPTPDTCGEGGTVWRDSKHLQPRHPSERRWVSLQRKSQVLHEIRRPTPREVGHAYPRAKATDQRFVRRQRVSDIHRHIPAL